MRETLRTFLQELDDDPNSGKEFLETEVLRIMQKDGFSVIQVYEMPLEKLLDRFYDAYLWEASRILSKTTLKSFMKIEKTPIVSTM
jgi:hypothetical protein